MVKLEINFISQNDPSIPEEWTKKSCGIVCLKMCLDFYGKRHGRKMPGITDLIDEGMAMRGDLYSEKTGWKHDALVWLAHNHGVPAYNEEFRSDRIDLNTKDHVPSPHSDALRDIGMERIKKSLDNGVPVVTSFTEGFGSSSSSHLVVVIGKTDEGFIVHDPSHSTPKESFQVPQSDFIKFWRKYAIFVG